MHTSAVDRATTTTTSINSRTGLERSRLQAWPGTAKGNGNNHHHGHANLRSSLSWHGEGAFSFYDVRHDGKFHCSLPLAREVVNLASCFSCGVARAEIDDASKKYPCSLLRPHCLSDRDLGQTPLRCFLASFPSSLFLN